ncbi:2-hydroxymuconic semialdehyde dehydrogenase [Glutamicibacter sp.]|uniref:2-hydroxymuconic semialdehyde dehydrogenase n=1 Tax=Glutamicibacter sp. TaxID=1931995 RepID=UPI002B473608|nr:2-hydroxymuconic semialdehyde dehydrogenase [Glutamicibacter sp.]HJX78131.1 2-hydroxymuconic semialdehyde dehydrogenase [Glutamicibacter sp.]
MALDLIRNFVGGEYLDGGSGFDNINPVDGTVVSSVMEADRGIVEKAVAAARKSLSGPWGRYTASQRAAIMRRIAERIEARSEDLLRAEIADTGKPEALARELDISRASLNFRAFADIIASSGADSFLTEFADGRRALNYALRKPLGVVAVVVPWNLPLLLLTWKVAPAIACGNAVVVKPSEETPSTATLLGEIMKEAGLPDGVYNVVHGFGENSAGEFLTKADGVDGITFTGESSTGSAIMRAAAPSVRPVSFELGGKNAALVFADADIEKAVNGLSRSIFTNTGQVCLCTERVYIQRPVFEEVVAGLVEKAKMLKLGRPTDPGTTTGPLISQKHRDKVLSYFRKAEDEGGTAVIGGMVPEMPAELANGSWIMPTLWTGLSHDSSPMREEVFGPVAGLVPFDSESEAVRLANDTRYGLAASVWTENLERGHRVGAQMNTGISWVNTWYLRDLRSPFGGSGLSGIGREGGKNSLHFYTEPTNICIKLSEEEAL